MNGIKSTQDIKEEQLLKLEREETKPEVCGNEYVSVHWSFEFNMGACWSVGMSISQGPKPGRACT